MFYFVTASLLLGCGSSPPPTEPSSPARAELSAEDCENQGGHVLGDIGDGATQRPDYVCPAGGAPLGSILPAPGGPIAVEGSVCCPK